MMFRNILNELDNIENGELFELKFDTIMNEIVLLESVNQFIKNFQRQNEVTEARIGSKLAALSIEIISNKKEITLSGFKVPTKVYKIHKNINNTLDYIDFGGQPRFPVHSDDDINPVYCVFFKDSTNIDSAISSILLALPSGWELINDVTETFEPIPGL